MKVCRNQLVAQKRGTRVMATAKLHGILHYKNKAQTSRFAFLFCNIIVDIFHHTILLCNYTREVYKHSLHPLTVIIGLNVGERKEVERHHIQEEKVHTLLV